MASFCSTSLLAPSLPMKIVPYVPRAPKPKPKAKPRSNAKSMATTEMAEQDLFQTNSFQENEWLDINNSPINLVAPAAFGDTDPFGVVDDLDATPFLEKPEHYQSSHGQLKKGETDHATSAVRTNMATDRLLDESSLDIPLILGDAADRSHIAVLDTSSSRVSYYQDNGHNTVVGNGGDGTQLHDDLDAVSMRTLSTKDVEDIQHKRPLSEAETRSADFGVANGPPVALKRMRLSSISVLDSTELLHLALGPELEDPRSVKRRRQAQRQEEGLVQDPVSAPESMQPTGDQVIPSRASNEPSLSLLDSNRRGEAARTPGIPPTVDGESSGDSAYGCKAGKELLHSLRQPSPPLETAEQNVDLGLDKWEGNSNGSEEDVGETDINKASGRASAKGFQRKGRNPPQVTLRARNQGTMPSMALRRVPSKSCQSSRTRSHRVTQSCSLQASGLTRARDQPTTNHGPSSNMAYQITDLTHCNVPEGSSIVTAIICCKKSNSFLNMIALDHKLLGDEGKVIRMTQLSPDSWMLLGYRYDDSVSSTSTRESATLRNTDWMGSPRSDATSHDTNHSNDGDEEYEEDPGQYQAKSEVRFRQRTRVPWLESDDLRLQAYKSNMGMKWKNIFDHFPDRTPGAVRTRWHTLQQT